MKRLLASCFGLGRLPIAPGTWGSLPPAIIFALLCILGIQPAIVASVMAVLALAGSVVCLKCAPAVVAETGNADPAEVVADEFAGQAITLIPAGFFIAETAPIGQVWGIALLGFILFRLFDIVKPWPIRKLEKLPGGWGILADDLLAGLYAAIFMILLFQFFSCRSCPLI